ncbi:Tim10/DDP family zinc finger-domain-containing protein [Spinellus fusiger]|nr:Tim10/DDP family zinc finger-domain-containing protein [Spinellus fusiger]
MSFYNAPTQQTVNPQNIAMAEQELDMFTDLFYSIAESCHTKCVSKQYASGDLTQGEAVCIDRCVAKYIKVNEKIGEKMKLFGQQQ